MSSRKLIPAKMIIGQPTVNMPLSHTIERKSLLNQLAQAVNYPLTLVTAPAGYGKTTLVAQWHAQLLHQKQAVIWLTLDEKENDEAQFWHYFSTAIANVTAIDIADLVYQNNTTHYLEQLLVKLAFITRPFYLIIDDYHLIQNDAIHTALRFWLKHQPLAMHLILLSRLTPPLSITHLRISHKLLEINAIQLAFTPVETHQFFELHFEQSLTEEQSTTLCENVEGWVAILQLVVFTLKRNEALLPFPEQWLEKVDPHYIADYLQEEVLYGLKPETLVLMQRCAILRLMNEKVVVALTADENAITQLDELEKNGRFIRRIYPNNTEIVWQFHPILSAYLAERCRLTLPNEWHSLHKIACTMWLKLGNPLEALYHAKRFEDAENLQRILHQYGWGLFHQGQLKLLEQSLQDLPAEYIKPDENLVLLQAWLAQSQHRHQEVSGILQKFEPKAPLTPSLQGHFDALKAQVAMNDGDEEKAYIMAKQALANLSSEFSYAQIVATSVIGEAQHCRGYLKEALMLMQKVEKMAIQQRAYHYWLWSRLQQSEILSAQGFWQTAYDLLKETETKSKAFQPIPMNEFLFRLKSKILWEWHNLSQAEKMANAGIKMLEKEADQVQCLTLLAKISLVKGDLDNVERLIVQCTTLLDCCSPHKDWLTAVDEIQLIYWQMTNQTNHLGAWLAQAEPISQEHNHKNNFTG